MLTIPPETVTISPSLPWVAVAMVGTTRTSHMTAAPTQSLLALSSVPRLRWRLSLLCAVDAVLCTAFAQYTVWEEVAVPDSHLRNGDFLLLLRGQVVKHGEHFCGRGSSVASICLANAVPMPVWIYRPFSYTLG